ncbi:MAG: PHP domain-containing protein [Thermoleophilia bacterium]|nr:PHP domain-containing protein [Thermoleophilia bacterium]
MTDTIRVDLHCHSSMSDGDHSPAYVAHSIAATGALWGALTDHNTVAGLEQFDAALAKRGLNSIAGVEIDSRSSAGPLHLLGYGFDPQNEPLLQALRTIQQPWRASTRHWVDRLRARRGRVASSDRTCVPQEGDSSPHRPPDTAEVICLLHEAGGLVFLAHPLAGLPHIGRLEEILEWLHPQGLDGIEAFHKQYSQEVQARLLQVAESRGLLTIAGSDFHGLHHSDGGSPGVDMPLVHWNRFLDALRAWQAVSAGALVTFDSLS